MINKQPFGHSGHESTVTIFGGFSLSNVTQDVADRTLDLLFEYGVNHIDTAPGYGDSEIRIGQWMRYNRDQFFLATKTEEREYRAALDSLYRSLERLCVDSIDLFQLHALNDPVEWELAMGSGGALEAAIEARAEGLIRFIGVTGHGWYSAVMHRRSISRFDFDSVLLPYNYFMMQNNRNRQDFEELEAQCLEKGIAIQTIKSLARGPWGQSRPNRKTWYQPLEERADIQHAVHWVLGRPGIFLNTVGDIDLLPVVLEAAARFEDKPEEDVMASLMRDRGVTSIFGYP